MTTPELVQLGTQLVNDAQAQNITLRLMGGVAIYANCQTVETNERLQHDNTTLEFIAAQADWNRVSEFFTVHGFTAENTAATPLRFMHGKIALVVSPPAYRGDFSFDFTTRLALTPVTLPLSDLMLLTLSRVTFRETEIQDATALLVDHRVTTGGDEQDDINREHIYQIANQDYRLWKTIFDNTVTLEKIYDKYLDPGEAQLCWRRTELLQEVLDGKAHSLGWWAGRLVTR